MGVWTGGRAGARAGGRAGGWAIEQLEQAPVATYPPLWPLLLFFFFKLVQSWFKGRCWCEKTSWDVGGLELVNWRAPCPARPTSSPPDLLLRLQRLCVEQGRVHDEAALREGAIATIKADLAVNVARRKGRRFNAAGKVTKADLDAALAKATAAAAPAIRAAEWAAQPVAHFDGLAKAQVDVVAANHGAGRACRVSKRPNGRREARAPASQLPPCLWHGRATSERARRPLPVVCWGVSPKRAVLAE